MYGLSAKKRALSKLQTLRTRVAVAKSWVEREPAGDKAKFAYEQAKKMLDTLETGIEKGWHPWAIVGYLADSADELAIYAEIEAKHYNPERRR